VIELRELRYFVAVAEERHFGRAAARLGIAQPPLSQAIARLERNLEVRLLDRSSRRVELTPAGAAFLDAARETIDEARLAVRAVNAAAAHDVVPVRTAATPAAGLATVPAVSAELARRAPGLAVVPVEMSALAVFAALLAHEADVGFVVEAAPPPALVAVVLRREPAVVVVGRANPLARRRRVTLAVAGLQPLAIAPRETGAGFYDRVVGVLAAAGVVPEVAVHSEAGPDWAGDLAAEGFALAPRSAASVPEAVHLPLADGPTLDTHVLWREDDDRPLVAAVVDAAKACSRARGWMGAT
jgi:DNA-binding transcriptional LysR family regulator